MSTLALHALDVGVDAAADQEFVVVQPAARLRTHREIVAHHRQHYRLDDLQLGSDARSAFLTDNARRLFKLA